MEWLLMSDECCNWTEQKRLHMTNMHKSKNWYCHTNIYYVSPSLKKQKHISWLAFLLWVFCWDNDNLRLDLLCIALARQLEKPCSRWLKWPTLHFAVKTLRDRSCIAYSLYLYKIYHHDVHFKSSQQVNCFTAWIETTNIKKAQPLTCAAKCAGTQNIKSLTSKYFIHEAFKA